jgi:hypothetical protein
MSDIDDQELTTVTGGARTVTSRRADAKLDYMMTKIASDIRDLAQPKIQQSTLLAMMMAMLAARRR